MSAAPGAGAAAPQPAYDSTSAPQANTGAMSENLAGALCYLMSVVTGILFLVLEPYNRSKFVRFHAFQSIFFCVAWIIIWIAFVVVSSILVHIPILGAIIGLLATTVLSLGGLVIWLFLMWKAYNNERFMLPIIGPLAEKQA